MEFIDTHSHLYSSKFNNDRDIVVKNALNKGVKKILLPNISSKYTQRMHDLCNMFPTNCFPMIGVHPCEINKVNYEKELTHVEEELRKEIYIAVGEIGIDLYWDDSNLNTQKKAFSHQIKLAKKYKLPIVIHIRESFNEAIKIVESLNDESLSGVFHCFSGSIDDAKRIIELENFYLGIGGVITFKNSNLDQVINEIDLKHILLETDSPYLAPAPHRGKRNESKYIIDIANKLSEIKDVGLDDISKITTENATRLFNL